MGSSLKGSASYSFQRNQRNKIPSSLISQQHNTTVIIIADTTNVLKKLGLWEPFANMYARNIFLYSPPKFSDVIFVRFSAEIFVRFISREMT